MDKKISIVTGASSGIGKELSFVLARHQKNLLLIARSEEKLKKITQEIKDKYQVSAEYLIKDLSKTEAAQEIFDYCQKQKLEVDILINNAGFGDFNLFVKGNIKKQLEIIQVNIYALVYLNHLFLLKMIAQGGGKIMNIASTAAFQPGPLMSVYYASKAFVLHFSEAIANELKPYNITVTAICPGPTASNFKQTANLGNSRLMKKRKLPSAKMVAEFAYKAMIKGRVVAIYGFRNYILTKLVNIIPRSIVVKIVRKLQEEF